MFPGDPAVLIGLPDGTFAAYDAICTHAGCTVEYVRVAGIIGCLVMAPNSTRQTTVRCCRDPRGSRSSSCR